MTVMEAKNVSVSVQDRSILTKCSLTVGRGEFIGIIGPNGSGKTTFLKSLRGIQPIRQGQIFLYDHLLTQMTDKTIARQVAYMQQSVKVGFGYSVKDIVMTARYPYIAWWQNSTSKDSQIVEEAMRYTGVWELREKNIQAISGGERQRVFLAKALAQDTDILLLDEPTAALDIGYADDMFRHCQELCHAGKTIVIVVHDLEMAAKFCSRLVLFANGQIVADGEPHIVMNAKNLGKAFHISSTVYEDALFRQRRIYVYPYGVRIRQSQHLRPGVQIPEEASTMILNE